jgi:hypothetical protein
VWFIYPKRRARKQIPMVLDKGMSICSGKIYSVQRRALGALLLAPGRGKHLDTRQEVPSPLELPSKGQVLSDLPGVKLVYLVAPTASQKEALCPRQSLSRA